MGEVPLCIELRHQRKTGARVLTAERLAGRAAQLGGAHYVSTSVDVFNGSDRLHTVSDVVPCPHRRGCAVAPLCSAAVCPLYAEVFGLSELAPVGRADIEATPGAELLWEALQGST